MMLPFWSSLSIYFSLGAWTGFGAMEILVQCEFYCKFISHVFEWTLVYDITVQSSLSICLSLGAWTGLGAIEIIVQCAYYCKLMCSQSCI